jgi:hypothetical protein
MTMRRTALSLLLLLLAVLAVPAGAALAQPSGSAEGLAAAAASAAGDFDDDGVTDLAVGVPGENDASGAVNVLYGGGTGLGGTGSQVFTGVGGGPVGGFFGWSLAAGDFDGDGFADLAAGAPFRAVGGQIAAGSVGVLYGSGGGLTTAGGQLFTQVGGAVEGGDVFGLAVAAGDFNDDGFADLAAGATGEFIGSVGGAGAVSVLYGSSGGLTTAGGQLFTQVGGAVEAEDVFGFAVETGDFDNDGVADLAVGAPGEDVGTRNSAGAVSVLYGSAGGLTTSGGQLFTQVGGAVEAGDEFGSSLAGGDLDGDDVADLAVGARSEAVGTAARAGAVSVLYGSAGGLTTSAGQLFTQVGGAVEANDLFGWAVGAGDFNGDGFADLAAGALGERVGTLALAGAVSVLYGSSGGLTTSRGQLFTQVGGAVEGDDQFGAEVVAGDFNDDGFAELAAGAPNEDVGGAVNAGAVSVLPGSRGGLTASGGRLFTQDSPGIPGVAEPLDSLGGFGFSVG